MITRDKSMKSYDVPALNKIILPHAPSPRSLIYRERVDWVRLSTPAGFADFSDFFLFKLAPSRFPHGGGGNRGITQILPSCRLEKPLISLHSDRSVGARSTTRPLRKQSGDRAFTQEAGKTRAPLVLRAPAACRTLDDGFRVCSPALDASCR